jgi:small subunit ribosomal protein S6e
MTFKFNISDKGGKAWKLEAEANAMNGKNLGDTIKGEDVSADFAGYEFEITGGSDKSGFPLKKGVEGIGLSRVLLTEGWGMHKKPKGVRKKMNTPKGLRLRKTVRGGEISEVVVQVNMKVLNDGAKKLAEIFADQNKAPEPEVKEEAPKAEEAKSAEAPAA